MNNKDHLVGRLTNSFSTFHCTCRCGRGSYPIVRAVSNIVKGNKVCKETSGRNGQLTTAILSPSPTTPSPTTPSPTTPSPSGTEKTETVSEDYWLRMITNTFSPRHPQAVTATVTVVP